MKKWYKIGLFFICIIIVCLMLVILWKRHTYPDDSMEQLQKEQVLEPEQKLQEELMPANQADITINCDTICLYEEINQKDGTDRIEEVQIPEEYIGMTRQQLEQALEQDVSWSLAKQKNGLVSQHLESFSKEQIKIVRIYDFDLIKEIGYYIMAQNHHVCVFEADKQTLYFQTGILLEDLPLSVQEEVIEGKYMDSEMEVFHFLESYSS